MLRIILKYVLSSNNFENGLVERNWKKTLEYGIKAVVL